MIAVLGSFRFPLETAELGRSLMRAVIETTLAEPGCRAYSYAEDVTEPGLFRVTELWDSREALAAHLAAPHMATWTEARAALGFFDRRITAYELGEGAPL